MSYIQDKYLDASEEIIFMPQKCRIPLFWRWVGGILFCWLLLIPTIYAIKYTLEFNAKEYAVTNKKVIEKYGIVKISCDEMRLGSVENITVNKSFWGGIFHFGDLCIQGTNRNNIYFRSIVNPEEARKELNKKIEALRSSN